MGLIATSDAQLMTGRVAHQRHGAGANRFAYNVYYLCLPLGGLDAPELTAILPVDRFAPAGFYRRDHGPRREGASLAAWARQQLASFELEAEISHIKLLTLPRIFGHVFNPVSFWFCFDQGDNLRAMIYEVNNTYGESHAYVTARTDGGPITGKDRIRARKLFHVSPFLERTGHYQFRTVIKGDQLGLWINHYDENETLLLSTSLIGHLAPLSKPRLRAALWRMPFITLKTIGLIHWQALKLKAKGHKFWPLPAQTAPNVSRSAKFNKL